jgi:hypothetical protein
MNTIEDSNQGSYVSQSTPQSTLAAWLGSGDAAAQAREQIQRRQRADALRDRAMALSLDGGESDTTESRWLRDQLYDLRRELAQLRAELPDLISQQIVDEVPELHKCLHTRTEVLRNGTQASR